MRTVIVYDSLHGNTEQIAQAIAGGLREAGEVSVRKASEGLPEDLASADLLVIGCPVHAWNISHATRAFFESLAEESPGGKQGAAFDTKFEGPLAGGAAKKIARRLRSLGFEIIAEPCSFFITGMEGPLKEGELERARAFGEELAARASAA